MSGIALDIGIHRRLRRKVTLFKIQAITKYHDRIYRTGDLVYENEEGNIIFIGRKDSQIKLRGNRIELGDLESAAAAIEMSQVHALFDADKQEIVLFIETTAEIKCKKV